MRRINKNTHTLVSKIAVSIVLGGISFYQLVLSPIFGVVLGAKCRYHVSCSVYAKEHIKRFGIRKGGAMALMRLLSCQPFARIQQQ